MDAYAWYTINRESHDRLHDRINEAGAQRLPSHAPIDHAPQRRRLRLSLGAFLLAIGTRLLAAQPITLASAGSITAPRPSEDAARLD